MLIFFLPRIEQPSIVHRFLPRIVESQSCGAMDTTTGEATSIYHGRKVHEALVGKLTRKNRPLVPYPLYPRSRTHKTLFPNPPLSTRSHPQTPNGRTVDWYPHNRRGPERSKMPLPTINTWLNTRLTRRKPRLKRTLSSTGTPMLPNRATDRLRSRTAKIKQAQGTASSFLLVSVQGGIFDLKLVSILVQSPPIPRANSNT